METTPAAGPERLLLHELTRIDLDTETLVVGITDLLDQLSRPLTDDAADTTLHRITGQLETLLTAHNAVELIGRRGELATPQTHNVIETDDATDLPADTVVRVIVRGIRYRGGLLRPASVIVSSGKGTQS